MKLADQNGPELIEQANGAPVTPEDLADGFRTQAWHLMKRHPIVGAYLVLAAAALAPTCDDERDVAKEFSDLIADFTGELGRLHARERTRHLATGQEALHGTC